MRIAVASGKGGTGKTTVATSLALSLVAQPGIAAHPPLFLDCDVEAPNAHLFLKPGFQLRHEVGIQVPVVDDDKCTHCGRCAEVCQYHAIAALRQKTLVFPQLCHGCGSCTRLCPEDAIREVMKPIGVLEGGSTPAGIAFAHGIMDVGEPMAVPVIRQLKNWAQPEAGQDVILDAPPGTSCPVVETVHGADFLLLVTEPTPFGLHDLRLAVEVARAVGIPAGVVINRDGIGDAGVDEFCASARLPVLMRIPFERAIAESTAQGCMLVDTHPEYVLRLRTMYREIAGLVNGHHRREG